MDEVSKTQMASRALVELWTASTDPQSSADELDAVLAGVQRELRALRADCAALAAKVRRNGHGEHERV